MICICVLVRVRNRLVRPAAAHLPIGKAIHLQTDPLQLYGHEAGTW
jgi:hypothetical protein